MWKESVQFLYLSIHWCRSLAASSTAGLHPNICISKRQRQLRRQSASWVKMWATANKSSCQINVMYPAVDGFTGHLVSLQRFTAHNDLQWSVPASLKVLADVVIWYYIINTMNMMHHSLNNVFSLCSSRVLSICPVVTTVSQGVSVDRHQDVWTQGHCVLVVISVCDISGNPVHVHFSARWWSEYRRVCTDMRVSNVTTAILV